MNQRQGIELPGRELLIDVAGANGSTPLKLQSGGFLAATPGNIEPFIRESATHAVEHFFGNQIANGAFHNAPGRGRAEVNELFRGKELLQLRLHLAVQIFEPLSAVTNHGRAEGAKSFLAHFDRARNVELNVSHKACESFHKVGETQGVSIVCRTNLDRARAGMVSSKRRENAIT